MSKTGKRVIAVCTICFIYVQTMFVFIGIDKDPGRSFYLLNTMTFTQVVFAVVMTGLAIALWNDDNRW